MKETAQGSWFKRLLLPGLAFKAVVIGGGYATGREIAEFFLPAGPWGGLAAMALATAIWCAVCVATFLIARAAQAYDYRAFFRLLLGRGWIAFEIAYLLFVMLILAVFGAAAGEIAHRSLGLTPIVGTVALMAGIAGCAAFGNTAVERLFAYVSLLLYGVYAVFLVLALTTFGDRIGAAFANAPMDGGWFEGGLTYASYNIVGAIVILPVTRHLTSNRDAITAGLIAGPLAMLPALMFFVCMTAFLPHMADEALPSDFLLGQLGQPAFHLAFQVMIFAALLESGTGAVHAINERIASAWRHRHGTTPSVSARATITLGLLVICMLVADRIGLIALIANGYRALAYVIIALYIVPLLTIGLWRLRTGKFAYGEAS
jgi:uncharacterized membrane protein YkvI